MEDEDEVNLVPPRQGTVYVRAMFELIPERYDTSKSARWPIPLPDDEIIGRATDVLKW